MWSRTSLRDRVEGNELDLSLNNLEVVPVAELAKLQDVTYLDLSCNLLTQLDNAFCTLKHLVRIDLSKNKLTALPHDFGNMANLQHLDLLGNEIKSLPASFYRLNKLTWLDLKDNPLEPELKKSAGDCHNEKQCRDCASNVLVFMMKIAIEEIRFQQQKRESSVASRPASRQTPKAAAGTNILQPAPTREPQRTTRTVRVPSHKLAVIADPFMEKTHGCQVTIRQDKGTVKLHGVVEECDKAKCELLTLIQNLHECSWTASAPIVQILSTPRGQRFLDAQLTTHPRCAIDRNTSYSVFEVVSLTKGDAEALVRDLAASVKTVFYQVSVEDKLAFEFTRMKTGLESTYLVCLELSKDEKNQSTNGVTIHGFGRDVDTAYKEVEKFILQHKISQETIAFMDLTARAFEEFYGREMEQIKTFVEQSGGLFTKQAADTGFTITFQCREEVLKSAKKVLTGLLSKIQTTLIHLASEFLSYLERALVINGLHEGGIETFARSFEEGLRQKGVHAIVYLTVPPKCPIPPLRVKPLTGVKPKLAWSHPDEFESMEVFTATIGQCIVSVKCGDLASEKADVLASPVTKDLDVMQTAVGRAIVTKHSLSVKKLQPSSRCQVPKALRQCQVFLTPIQQNQQGQHAPQAALFAVMDKWKPAEIHKNVKLLLQACLSTASSQTAVKSIAVPAFGTGKLFQFPHDTVVSGMVEGLLEFLEANPASFQEITIAVYHVPTVKRFKKVLEQKIATSYTGGDNDDSNADGSDDDFRDAQSVQDLDMSFDSESLEVSMSKSQPAASQSAKFEASFCTHGDADRNVLRENLLAKLKEEFLFTLTIGDAQTLRRLHPSDIKAIQEESLKKNVVLRIREKGTKLIASGVKVAVSEVMVLVGQKMAEFKGHQEVTISKWRLTAGIPAITHRPPSYWEISQKLGLQDTSETAVHLTAGEAHALKPVSAAEAEEVKRLMTVLWDSSKVGIGKDARNLKHTKLNVLDVRRLENPELWEKYSESREKLLRRLKHRPSLSPVEKSSPRGPVETSKHIQADSLLHRDIFNQVNEHYLFHGTAKKAVVPISRDGLDSRLAGAGSMLGRGIYAAESPIKSDQYADRKEGRTSGEKLMILVRMLLGEAKVTHQRVRFDRPPCKKCDQPKCSCENSEQYDSVIFDYDQGLFREFIVYERCLCYPEYFITYQRV